jgi:lysine/ornithine N-monooxygenase
MQHHDVIIVGAGPYGLSTAAHLRTIPGLQVRTFGQPMSFWEGNMPAGMFLRSPWAATHIASPKGRLNLEAYVASRGNHLSKPIPLDRFIDYGRWFQKEGVPDLDPRKIQRIERGTKGFQLTAEDGETMTSSRVIVATGIAPFARRPAECEGLPASLVSHSSDHTDSKRFSNQRMLVVGAGQSALESAALLHEAGANVELIVRNPQLRWLKLSGTFFRRGLLGKLLYSPRDVGPAGMSQLTARPDYLRLFPRGVQNWVGRRAIRPAGATWLINRLKDVPVRTGLQIRSAVPVAGQLRVTLTDGSEQIVDHLMCATGYRIDIAKYSFLDPQLVHEIDRIDGYPRLQSGLECSVPGLHFLGAPAAWSFGPVARFVSGTFYCVAAVTRKIAATQ